MIRECFMKNFFAKYVPRNRRFFDELEELFLSYFQLLHTFAKTAVYDE